MSNKSIGDLNGPWALLLRLNLIAAPVAFASMVALNVWFVRSIHSQDVRVTRLEEWKAQGPRFTSIDAQLLESRLKQWHTEDLEKRNHE